MINFSAELNANDDASPSISLEHDILPTMAGTGKFFAFMTDRFWMSIKSAGSAIYANRVMLGEFFDRGTFIFLKIQSK